MAKKELIVKLILSADQFSRTFDASVKKAKGFRQAMGKIGRGMTTTVTAPIVAMGTAALKVSIDFEDAFAGVKKTVTATGSQFAKLREGILDLSKRTPIAATEIARVAEVAGQLGVKAGDLLSFTETMLQLGVATNLTAEQAAINLSRFANVVDLPREKLANLASAVVVLGNNFATFEDEIVELTTRLAGAGDTVKLTEAQILAFATAMSSVGIRAEAGATAFTKAIVGIASDVALGGEKLSKFAAVAGQTAQEFSVAFRKNAGEAIASFIQGLDQLEGPAKFKVLKDLGLDGARVQQVFLRLSGASEILRAALDQSSQGWATADAQVVEFGKKVDTTGSQLKILVNRIRAVGIELGDKLAKPLNDVVQKIAGWIDSFQKLHPAVKTAIGVVVGLAAAIGPLALLISGVTKAIAGLKIAITFLAAHPLVALVAGIALVVVALGVWISESEMAQLSIKKIWAGIQLTFAVATDAIVKRIAFVLGWIPKIGKALEELSEKTGKFREVALLEYGKVAFATKKLERQTKKTGKSVKGALTDMGEVAVKTGKKIGEMAEEAKKSLKPLEDVAKKAREIFKGALVKESVSLEDELNKITLVADAFGEQNLDLAKKVDVARRAIEKMIRLGASPFSREVQFAKKRWEEFSKALAAQKKSDTINKITEDFHKAIAGIKFATENLGEGHLEAAAKVDAVKEALRGLAAQGITTGPQIDLLKEKLRAFVEELQSSDEIQRDLLIENAGAWGEWFSTMSEKFSSLGDVIRGVGDIVFDAFQNIAASVGDSLGDALVFGESFADAMSNAMKRMAANFISSLVNLATQLVIFWALSKLGFKTMFGASLATQSGRTYAAAFASVVEALPWPFWMVVAPFVATNATLAMAQTATGFASFSAAEGGIATRPMFGLFGEAGPEAFIPLKHFRNRLGGPTAVYLQIDGRTVAKAVQENWGDTLSIRLGGAY